MLRKEKKLSRIERIHRTAFIGAIIALIGGFFLSYNYVQAKKVMAYDYMSNAFYNGSEIIEIVEEEEKIKPLGDQDLPGEVSDEYVGFITIPKINLTKGFHDKRSSQNNVDTDLLVVSGSNYPNIDKGNFIVAGHSGTGWNSFFNDLYKLDINDTVYVSFQGKKYIYNIVNIYKQPKVGKLAIYRDYEKTTLTLITCTNYDSTTQTLYIAELKSVENINNS